MTDISSNNRSYLTIFSWGVCRLSLESYNKKVVDRMHGLDWYDYGARHYDAALGRWMCVAPLAEKYFNVSGYIYIVLIIL